MKSIIANKLIIKRILLLLAIVFWCFLIFSLSGETSDVSSVRSDGISRGLLKKIFDIFSILGEPSEDTVETLEIIIRKLAHFFAYFIMCILCLLFAFTFHTQVWIKYAFSFAFCFLYAVSDELHQTFVSGRWGSARDVFLDCVGVLTAIVLYITIRTIRSRKKNNV